MRLSISNIAWDVAEDAAVARLLERYALDAIDVAPGKYFPGPGRPPREALARVRQWWADQGVEITGMQALLFGADGLNLFGAPEVRRAMLERLATVCEIGAGLGATRLTFGSPRNRDRAGLTDAQADELATAFFLELGGIAAGHGVTVCIEPNPAQYGCNFVNRTAEAAALVERVGHPAIRVQLDTGALAMNGEDAAGVLRAHAHLVGHVHASEPNLVPLGDATTDHARLAALIGEALPEHVVTIEMRASTQEPHAAAIERALRLATLHYRDTHATVC
jgi:D-psicose/D-tagatose/L-ribulose 3-epimerase